MVCGMIFTLVPGAALAGTTVVTQKIELKSSVVPALPASTEGGLVGKAGKTLLAAAVPLTLRADGEVSICRNVDGLIR